MKRVQKLEAMNKPENKIKRQESRNKKMAGYDVNYGPDAEDYVEDIPRTQLIQKMNVI